MGRPRGGGFTVVSGANLAQRRERVVVCEKCGVTFSHPGPRSCYCGWLGFLNFDSKSEATRWHELRMLVDTTARYSNLRRQVTFELHVMPLADVMAVVTAARNLCGAHLDAGTNTESLIRNLEASVEAFDAGSKVTRIGSAKIDFVYERDGEIVYEDHKGKAEGGRYITTAVSRLKFKHIAAQYGTDVEIHYA